MKETKIVSAFVLALALLSIGCASDVPKGAAYPAPPGFQGFPRSTSDEGVHVEAFFDPDHEDVFDIDLVEGGVIPVRLKIQLRGEGMSTKIVKLDRDLWDMRLYLQDGTVVPAVSAAKLAAPTDGLVAPTDRDRILHGRMYRPTLQRGPRAPRAEDGKGLSGPAGFILD